ncbi:hypothetical protein L6R50_10415 [Myxococcota bacterium]|nr:hypothetical protein [Myxococcota bacterium]
MTRRRRIGDDDGISTLWDVFGDDDEPSGRSVWDEGDEEDDVDDEDWEAARRMGDLVPDDWEEGADPLADADLVAELDDDGPADEEPEEEAPEEDADEDERPPRSRKPAAGTAARARKR